MKKEKNNEFKVRKPSFFIYVIPAYIVKFIAKIYWRMKTDNKEIRALKQPFLCVAPHASTIDIMPVVCTLLPRRVNMVAAKDLFTWKQLKPFITRFGAIPMNQCGMDLSSIKYMQSAAKQGLNIMIFPEGKTSLDGKQMFYLNPSIGKLVKLIGLPVVLVQNNGAYATKPRYIKGFRRGRMESKASVLVSPEELKTISPKEIYDRIKEGLKYNDNVWWQNSGVKFKAKELASNLNYILYKCPKCGSEYEMKAEGDLLVCKKCNNTVRYTADGRLVAEGDSTAIERIDKWMDYERKSVLEELQDDNFSISKRVELYKRDDVKHDYFKEGEGELFLNKDYIGYVGTRQGEEWRMELPLANMPMIVTKNKEGVDLILDNKTFRFMFTEKKYSAKYSLIVECLFATRHGIDLFEE